MTALPITDFAGFARVWPDIARRVERSLVRRGVAWDVAADAVAEVALRALRRIADDEGFPTPGDLAQWSYRVANNVVVSRWRADRRLVYSDVEVVADDVAEDAHWRVLLDQAAAAMDALPSPQFASVVDLLSGRTVSDRRQASRESTRRLRARAQLRRIIGGLPVVWPWRRLRWVGLSGAIGGGLATSLAVVALAAVADRPTAAIEVSTVASFAAAEPEAGSDLVAPAHEAATHRPSPARAHPTAGHPAAPPSDRVPVVRFTAPTGSNVEVGTRPDEQRPFVCAESTTTTVCVPKALGPVRDLLAGGR